jgi:TonB-linked SusC/RagA family outer membrane protein
VHEGPQSGQPTGQGLDATVRVEFDRISVEDALRFIVNEAHLELSYSTREVAVPKPVTLHLGSVTARAAIRAVLQGTGLELHTRPNGQMVIVKDDASSQQNGVGVVRGKVTDAETKKALANVTIAVAGTKLAATTSEQGMYIIGHVPSGKQHLTVRLLGYGTRDRSISIQDNDTTIADFSLAAVPARLQEVVTTGSGNQQRLEVGNSIATIDAEDIVPTTPIRNLSDLLKSRAPGVDVLSTSGAVGSGSQIRIRGVRSLLASSDPIVIIDGVRVDASYSDANAGGSLPTAFLSNADGVRSVAVNQQTGRPATSRLDDIDPESIEKIEVLKGPSAATLYGSDAANGVIVITTKRGHPGPTRWTFFGQRGMSHMDATFQDAWFGWGSRVANPGTAGCDLLAAASGQCIQDSVTHYNPLNHKDTSPFGTGQSSKYGVQVSGGSAQLQYFVGTDYTNDLGMERLPSVDAQVLLDKRSGAALPDWLVHPNVLQALHVVSNLTAQLGSKADIGLTSNVTHEYHRDNAGNQFIGASLRSQGYRDSAAYGWGNPAFTPASNFLIQSNDVTNRGSGGITANWRPTNSLSGHSTFGADYAHVVNEGLEPRDIVPGDQGTRGRTETTTLVRTADIGANLDIPLLENLRLRSSVGGQYTRNDQDGLSANASGLAEGSDIVNNATETSVTEFHSAQATAGWYIQESFALNERLFLTGAVRGDASSSFGRNAKTVYYPKWSLSWLLSQEPYFPHVPGLSNIRLRAAYGHAGVQPPIDARFRSFKSAPAYVQSQTYPGIVVSTVGNPLLRPERSTELEGGFDLGLLQDRISIEATLYRELTRDALVTRDLPPSLGVINRQENLGKVDNRGLEITTTIEALRSRTVDWNMTIGFSQNRNRLVTLGPAVIPPTGSSAIGQTRYVAGYPLDAFWARPVIGYSDLNGDGIISASEVRLGDSVLYRGQPFPKADIAFHNDLSLFSGWLNIGTTFDYVGGLTQLDNALYNQCLNDRCSWVQDPSTSLAEQAYAVVSGYSFGYDPNIQGSVGGSDWGFLERVSWLRLTELSFTLSIPQTVARKFRASSANISLMGRNLGLWTKYNGADPEVNTNIFANQIVDAGGIPQPREWSIRVNLGY